MEILSLKLKNYRNFENLELNFSDRVNVIIGNNGEGKTNIVESIFVLALTKSFRCNDENNLIKYNTNFFRIEGNIKSTFVRNFKYIYQNNFKTVKIDNNKLNKLSDYISNINLILFNVNDLNFIKDTPNTRRKLINLEISQYDNKYIKLLNYYNKILKQRNSYLKKIKDDNFNYSYLEIIDSQLISYGKEIFNIRKKFIENINIYLNKFNEKFGGVRDLLLLYKSDYDKYDINKLVEIYKKNIKRDIFLGSTQIGVHRDDFVFSKDNKEIKLFASEGQQKLALLSFKFSELEVFKEKYLEYPILILDDLFSELDTKKIESIFKSINNDVQVFITTTDLKKIRKKYLNNIKVFKIKNGNIKEDYYE